MERSRSKYPALFMLGSAASPTNSLTPAEFESVRSDCATFLSRYRGTPGERARLKEDRAKVAREALEKLIRQTPSLESFLLLIGAVQRDTGSFAAVAAALWGFGDFIVTPLGQSQRAECTADQDQAGKLAALAKLVCGDLRGPVLAEGQQRHLDHEQYQCLEEAIGAAERLEESLAGLLSGFAAALRAAKASSTVSATSSEEPSVEQVANVSPSRSAALAELGMTADHGRAWALKRATEERSKNRQNPWPYLLARVVLWMDLETPLKLHDGPDEATQRKLTNSPVESLPAQNLEQYELLLARFPLWLTLQHYVAINLERLGLLEIREAVRFVACSLVQIFPELPTMEFSNKVPVASPSARQWLQQEQERFRSASGRGIPALPDDNPLAALGILQSTIERSRGARTRFRMQLEMARYCLDHAEHGRAHLAIPLLDRLDQDATAFQLEQWEPELLVDVLMLKERAAVMTGANNAEARRLLLTRLCPIDPVLAAKLDVEA